MRRLGWPLAAITALLVAAGSSIGEPAVERKLSAEALLSMVQIGGSLPSKVAISPDGRYVAYTEARPEPLAETGMLDALGVGRKYVRIIDTRTSAIETIPGIAGDAWNPVWSPDGKRLALYSGSESAPHLAVWDVKSAHLHETGVPVATPEETFGSTVHALWTGDSERIVVPQPAVSSVPAIVQPTSSPSVAVFESKPGASESAGGGNSVTPGLYRTLRPLNLALIDVQSGRVRMIPTQAGLTALSLSLDGTHAFYVINRGEINNDVNSRELFDVAVVDLSGGSVRIVAKNIVTNYHAYSLSWSHRGDEIAFIGGVLPDDDGVTTADHGGSFPGHCYVIDLRSQAEPRRIGNDLFEREQAPLLWSADDRTLYATDQQRTSISAISVLSGQSKKIVQLGGGRFVVSPHLMTHAGSHQYLQVIGEDGQRRLYDVDLERSTLHEVMDAYQNMDGMVFDRSGNSAAYVGQDPRHAPDVWFAQHGASARRQLTHLNPQIESSALGDAESVSWTTASGLKLNGALLLPAGYELGKRYPTITWIYGGEPEGTSSRTVFGLSMSRQAPYFNLQLLASRGYAVFVPDTELHIGTPMKDLADEVLPGLDKIIAMGIADPARLGVYGQSYGGYSTLALLVQSERFKAAVAMSGISDIFATYGAMYEDGGDWTSWAESQQGRMGGTPWEQRQRYLDNSPFFYLDRVKTPILLEYGNNDRFAAINWEQTFVALRRLGRASTLLRYSGEGHVLLKRSNQLDFCKRMIDWFATYLPAST